MVNKTNFVNQKYLSPLLLMLVIQLCGCTTTNTYPISDHYDGKRFHNPVKIPKWTNKQLLAHIQAGHHVGNWPDHVHNDQLQQCDIQQDSDNPLTVTYINHSTVLLQVEGITILTDPVWSQRVGPFGKFGPTRIREPGVSFELLPKVDLVLVSHDHYDHMDIPTLKRIVKRDDPNILVPLGNKQILQSHGIDSVVELDWWGVHIVDEDTQVVMTPTQHTSGRLPWLKKNSLWGGFLILNERPELSIYFAGDTAYETHFLDIEDRYGAIDLALHPIGGYKPRELHQSVHMDALDAIRAHENLQANYTLAIHHGTFPLSAESYEEPFRELNHYVLEKGLASDRILYNTEGKTLKFISTDGQIQLSHQCAIGIASN